MIETITPNLATYTELDADMPSGWQLGNLLPGGALSQQHVEWRSRLLNKYWTDWAPVTSWDNENRQAIAYRPGVHEAVQFRRATPRYAAYLDPLAGSSRVSQKNLQTNADQGVFAAIEWAADYGINAYSTSLLQATNDLQLQQQTQNHWGPDTDFTQVEWNFQFAGGYLDRTHVRAAVRRKSNGAWVQFGIDPSEISNSVGRFTGPFQLHLELAEIGFEVDGLVIYRHTPRNGNVLSPLDDTRITAGGMEPSARHALFVAVEIGEALSQRVGPCACPPTAYTTDLYPIPSNPSVTLAALDDFLAPWAGINDKRVGASLGPEVISTGARDAATWQVWCDSGYLVRFAKVGQTFGGSAGTVGVDTTQVSIGFDSSSDLLLSWQNANGSHLRYQNYFTETTTELMVPGTTSCAIAMDDPSSAQLGAIGGAMWFYTRGGNLYWRQQSDVVPGTSLYGLERLVGPVGNLLIDKAGPTTSGRIQVQLSPPP